MAAEAQRLAQREARNDLNAAEAHYYTREIQQASAYLTLNPRSTDGEHWRQQLGYALTTIGHPLFQLKAKRDA